MAAAVCSAGAPADAADLVLKRVVLSTGGVGYFEYEAAVEGDATLALDVPLDQVDDVLKSLVVYDAGGSAGEITLPGREPLTQSFVDLPFDRAALNSATDLLERAARRRDPGRRAEGDQRPAACMSTRKRCAAPGGVGRKPARGSA